MGNAILLMELTMDYSDLDRLKYLNVILLTEFKNMIQKTHDLKSQYSNADQNSSLDHDENYESINNILTENKIQIAHIAKDLLLAEIKNSSQNLDNFESEHIENDHNSITDSDENDGLIEEMSTDPEDFLLTEVKNSIQKPDNFVIELIEDHQNSVDNYDESN